jgi:hypothetical protein
METQTKQYRIKLVTEMANKHRNYSLVLDRIQVPIIYNAFTDMQQKIRDCSLHCGSDAQYF